MGNSRVKMGILLLKVKKILADDLNRFRKWCYDNVKKLNGEPFSNVTLGNYLKYARNPSLMPKERARQREYVKKRAEAIKYVSPDFQINGATYSEQVNRLMYAWDHAANDARQQFMRLAGLVRE